jgi:hypothetical protein
MAPSACVSSGSRGPGMPFTIPEYRGKACRYPVCGTRMPARCNFRTSRNPGKPVGAQVILGATSTVSFDTRHRCQPTCLAAITHGHALLDARGPFRRLTCTGPQAVICGRPGCQLSRRIRFVPVLRCGTFAAPRGSLCVTAVSRQVCGRRHTDLARCGEERTCMAMAKETMYEVEISLVCANDPPDRPLSVCR